MIQCANDLELKDQDLNALKQVIYFTESEFPWSYWEYQAAEIAWVFHGFFFKINTTINKCNPSTIDIYVNIRIHLEW